MRVDLRGEFFMSCGIDGFEMALQVRLFANLLERNLDYFRQPCAMIRSGDDETLRSEAASRCRNGKEEQ